MERTEAPSGDDDSSPDDRMEAFAETQQGAINRAQLIEAGFTTPRVKRRLEARRLRKTAARGVYLLPGSPPGWRRDVWVAVLAGPIGTVASHTTAAALYTLVDPPRTPHVTVPRHASGQRGDAIVHHATVESSDRDRVDGLPTTAVARTIVDCATILDQPALNRLTDAAIGRGLTTLEALRAARGRAGALAGAARLREALAPYAGGIPPGSVKEAHTLRLFRQWNLPPPECQYVIRNERGEFVAQVDFAWPLFRLALEYDGDEAHAPRKWSADDDRAEAIEALGWRLERADRHDLRPSSTRLRSLLTNLLRHPA